VRLASPRAHHLRPEPAPTTVPSPRKRRALASDRLIGDGERVAKNRAIRSAKTRVLTLVPAPPPTVRALAADVVPARERTRRARTSDPTALLWRRFARSRGADTRNALVELYQCLVADFVRRFALRLPRSIDTGDLLTAANVGLIAAVESFDPRRGVPFESYCELRLRGALLDELRSQDWLPRPWRARLERHKRVVERLRARLSREPSEAEITSELGMDPLEYATGFLRGLAAAPAAALQPPEDDEGGGGMEVMPDPCTEAPGERLTREDLLALVAQKLSPQEARIVYLKYWEDLSLREIGELEGLSESRVCKIHMKLLERLQERLRASADA
jgi:RNA polymerase sigma factor for flagellar operon FliA